MAQSTALAFYIACIAAKGAKAASFSVSPLKTGQHQPVNSGPSGAPPVAFEAQESFQCADDQRAHDGRGAAAIDGYLVGPQQENPQQENGEIVSPIAPAVSRLTTNSKSTDRAVRPRIILSIRAATCRCMISTLGP